MILWWLERRKGGYLRTWWNKHVSRFTKLSIGSRGKKRYWCQFWLVWGWVLLRVVLSSWDFKILVPGFAFANVEAAAEFEDQRTRFFADHERYDDYMEMREGLDLTNIGVFKENVIALADPDRMPWYANRVVFWISSFCLLSWPLRLILEYNTAYVHYQVSLPYVL